MLHRSLTHSFPLIRIEESFIMPDECIRKNGDQALADSSQRAAWDISGESVFNLFVTGENISAVSSVPGLEQGITDEIDAFMMTFKEHGAFLYYLKPPLDHHGTLLVNGSSAPSSIVLGKPFSDKADPFSAA